MIEFIRIHYLAFLIMLLGVLIVALGALLLDYQVKIDCINNYLSGKYGA